LPTPVEVLTLIADRLEEADISTGYIVQTWGEAATNPAVRSTANEFYASAFDFLREYVTLWLTADQGVEIARAHEQAEN
uniref:hypothetical protein n=1 Tax=Leucobacter japonicus TaxID=1461259 RepID=UPI000A993202